MNNPITIKLVDEQGVEFLSIAATDPIHTVEYGVPDDLHSITATVKQSVATEVFGTKLLGKLEPPKQKGAGLNE